MDDAKRKRYYDKLVNIMFREKICSLHGAQCWYEANKRIKKEKRDAKKDGAEQLRIQREIYDSWAGKSAIPESQPKRGAS